LSSPLVELWWLFLAECREPPSQERLFQEACPALPELSFPLPCPAQMGPCLAPQE
jgi:hypothetical protein